MDCGPPALSLQAVLGETGIGSPGLVDEIERPVAPISRRQCRDGVDRHLKLPFGPHSFGVLSSQGRVELFQLCNRRPQLIARAPQRFRRALLRRADPNHEQCREREKRDSQRAIGSYEERMHRRDEEVIESENGEPDSKQARTDPSKPGGEQHRTKKQRDERRILQKSVHR